MQICELFEVPEPAVIGEKYVSVRERMPVCGATVNRNEGEGGKGCAFRAVCIAQAHLVTPLLARYSSLTFTGHSTISVKGAE